MNANKIIDGLWLGGWEPAVDSRFIKVNNIGAVINCTPDIPSKFLNHGVDYLRLNLNDSLKKEDVQKMIKYLPYAVDYLHRKRDHEKKTVYVHCHAGMQRSATVVIAYLCKYHGFGLNQAINFILRMRPAAFHYGKHLNFSDALLYYSRPQNKVLPQKNSPHSKNKSFGKNVNRKFHPTPRTATRK